MQLTAKPVSSVLFQSTSVIADGRILGLVDGVKALALFQSTSVIADGRIQRRPHRQSHRQSGFNPRPSLLTDESGTNDAGQLANLSFNPRPSLLTDESADAYSTVQGRFVSIHVRHC